MAAQRTPKRQFDPAEAARAAELASHGVPQKQIALILWGARDDQRLRELYGDQMEASTAITTFAVSGKLYDACLRGEAWAICFWLKCRAGWSEKTTLKLEVSEEPDIDALRKKVGRAIAARAKAIAATEVASETAPPPQQEGTPCA
jgi:hypothetical protein